MLALLPLTGCDTFFGENEGPPLPGERISVMKLNRSLVPDSGISDLRVRLPQPYANTAWPQSGGYSTHAMYHLAAPESLNVGLDGRCRFRGRQRLRRHGAADRRRRQALRHGCRLHRQRPGCGRRRRDLAGRPDSR